MNSYVNKIQKSSDLQNKKKVRDFIMDHFNCKTIVGLAGPSFEEYIEWCKSKGFKNITVYEKHNYVLMTQITQIKDSVNLIHGDINSVTHEKNVFYDLDYCSTIIPMKDKISKFEENYCMTFSRRLLGSQNTINQFFKSINQKILHKQEEVEPIKHTVFYTEKGTYIYAPYWDSSAMCCIAKVA